MVFTSINQTKIAQFKKMCMWDAGTHCCPIRVTINKFDTWLSFLPVYQSFRINGLPQCIPRAVNCKQIFAIQSPAPRVDCIAFYHEGKIFPSAHKYREILYNRGSPLYKSVSKAGVALIRQALKFQHQKKFEWSFEDAVNDQNWLLAAIFAWDCYYRKCCSTYREKHTYYN